MATEPKYRPSTQGCREWSCLYHGGQNRFKAAHEPGCPIREYDGFVTVEVAALPKDVRCNCRWSRED